MHFVQPGILCTSFQMMGRSIVPMNIEITWNKFLFFFLKDLQIYWYFNLVLFIPVMAKDFFFLVSIKDVYNYFKTRYNTLRVSMGLPWRCSS